MLSPGREGLRPVPLDAASLQLQRVSPEISPGSRPGEISRLREMHTASIDPNSARLIQLENPPRGEMNPSFGIANLLTAPLYTPLLNQPASFAS